MIPTEPIGSLPRPPGLVHALEHTPHDDPRLDPLYDDAIRDTIERFEATGSPVITDGEQRKYHNFWTYSVHGLPNTAPDGFRIPFTAGHTRRMPRADGGAVPLQALCGQLSRCREAIRAPAAQAGGHLSVGAEPDVSRPKAFRATRASSSSTTCWRSTKPRSAAAFRRAPTRCRSTSPKAVWP